MSSELLSICAQRKQSMEKSLPMNKPAPVVPGKELIHFNRNSDVSLTISALQNGQPVLITDFYSNGLYLFRELQRHLQKTFINDTFQEQRAYRSAFQALSKLVLVEIVQHKLDLKKAPQIGWLKILYPELNNFLLPFSQIQGLNSAWQWYENGITIPVLRNKLHPYYGTYFPTRFDHLILFDNWLKRYEGPKKTAIEIGVGSGVISFQLMKHGFQKVYATDTNPNAIIGLQEFLGETKLSRKIELDFAHLFGKWDKPTELIVFNPPWLPATKELDHNDEAMYYPADLFPTFFAEAKKRLSTDGKLVLIFSNLAQITGVSEAHPIEQELATGERFVLEKCLKRPVKVASDKTNRDQHWRAEEEVELWVLVHK
jgi:hypothetical protein